jgi:hypothetical protein
MNRMSKRCLSPSTSNGCQMWPVTRIIGLSAEFSGFSSAGRRCGGGSSVAPSSRWRLDGGVVAAGSVVAGALLYPAYRF